MKRKEKHTFYNYQFKHTAVKITDHPNIQSVDVAEALGIHPIMLYRWRQEMRDGKIEDNKEEKRERKGREGNGTSLWATALVAFFTWGYRIWVFRKSA